MRQLSGAWGVAAQAACPTRAGNTSEGPQNPHGPPPTSNCSAPVQTALDRRRSREARNPPDLLRSRPARGSSGSGVRATSRRARTSRVTGRTVLAPPKLRLTLIHVTMQPPLQPRPPRANGVRMRSHGWAPTQHDLCPLRGDEDTGTEGEHTGQDAAGRGPRGHQPWAPGAAAGPQAVREHTVPSREAPAVALPDGAPRRPAPRGADSTRNATRSKAAHRQTGPASGWDAGPRDAQIQTPGHREAEETTLPVSPVVWGHTD